jgi:methylated-DNA-[protein]-cysteine S-methyltransferase
MNKLQIDSPLGPLTLLGEGAMLTGLYMENESPGADAASDVRTEILARAAGQLKEYFAGERHAFDLPLKPIGTPFQQRVWHALAGIAYGETLSYGELARRIGQPGAARAVGLANGRNPISIVIPCHRVIGADGSLTGYGGGLERKRWLLAHEQGASSQDLFSLAADKSHKRVNVM